MKKMLSRTRTALTLALVTVIFFSLFAYMLARPISYGLTYQNESVYDGETFTGMMKFYSDGTVVNLNTNFNDELRSYYHYKDGYVFFILENTPEAYEEQVAYIEGNFEEAVNVPFFASRINVFTHVAEAADGYTTIYTCHSAITSAVVCSMIGLALMALTISSLVLSRKSKAKT